MYGYDYSIETIQKVKIENGITYVKCSNEKPFVRLLVSPNTEYEIVPEKDKVKLYLPSRTFPINRAFAELLESKTKVKFSVESGCSITISKDGIEINGGTLPITINGGQVNLGDATSDILTKQNFLSNAIITAPPTGGLCTLSLGGLTNKSKA